MRLISRATLLGAAMLPIACVDGGDALPEIGRAEPLRMTSDHGLARITVSMGSEEIDEGATGFRVSVQAVEGESRAELDAVRAIMPAHGHEAPAEVLGQDREGTYLVPNVRLFMPGRWEVWLSLAIDGVEDNAAFAVDVD